MCGCPWVWSPGTPKAVRALAGPPWTIWPWDSWASEALPTTAAPSGTPNGRKHSGCKTLRPSHPLGSPLPRPRPLPVHLCGARCWGVPAPRVLADLPHSSNILVSTLSCQPAWQNHSWDLRRLPSNVTHSQGRWGHRGKADHCDPLPLLEGPPLRHHLRGTGPELSTPPGTAPSQAVKI